MRVQPHGRIVVAGASNAAGTRDFALIRFLVPPALLADAGVDQATPEGQTAQLDGSGSIGAALSYLWEQVAGPDVALSDTSSPTPTLTAPPVSGTTQVAFRLTTSDGPLASDAEVVVTVKNGAPLCELGRATPGLLWPPNHTMAPVSITGVTDPDDDATTITVTAVTQDEPTYGLGDGDTSPDAVLQGGAARIPAERAGTGNGRVYRLHFTASDSQAGLCVGTTTVTAPKSMKPGQEAVDDGQAFDSTTP